nr:hypothetical protein Saspl_014046 [Ipomoea trifida]
MSRSYLHPGPIDSSLLTYQVHHRSESVWANAGFNSLLNCAHYASAAYRVVTDDRIERLLRQSGFYGVTRLGYMKLDHHLITALVEHWRPEVHAFHLPFGEVTITLQDVEVLLGLKVDGRPVIGKMDQSIVIRFAQIETLLGFTPTANDFNSTTIKISSLDRHVATFQVETATDEQCEHQYVLMWEQHSERLTIIAPHAPLGPTASPLYDHWFYRYGRRLIGNPDHHQPEGYLQTAPSYIATVEALRHISIDGDMAEERGESNDYTNVMQNIARDELVRLRYGYVLDFPRNDQEFMYEPIPQVRGPDRRRDVNRRGRPAQGGHRRRHAPPRDVEENVDLEDNIDHNEINTVEMTT